MRVAVLFYGRILHFDKQYLFKVLDRTNNYDFYYSCEASDELIGDFINLYEPIATTNESISYSVDFGIYPGRTESGTNIHNMTCHFINLKRVFQLLEEHISKTGIQYDLILTTRLDLRIKSVDLVYPDKNTLYIPSGEDYTGINDRFAMGDLDSMRGYMNIFDNCLYLLDKKLAIPHPETLTLANIRHCGIEVKRFPMDSTIVK